MKTREDEVVEEDPYATIDEMRLDKSYDKKKSGIWYLFILTVYISRFSHILWFSFDQNIMNE